MAHRHPKPRPLSPRTPRSCAGTRRGSPPLSHPRRGTQRTRSSLPATPGHAVTPQRRRPPTRLRRPTAPDESVLTLSAVTGEVAPSRPLRQGSLPLQGVVPRTPRRRGVGPSPRPDREGLTSRTDSGKTGCSCRVRVGGQGRERGLLSVGVRRSAHPKGQTATWNPQT